MDCCGPILLVDDNADANEALSLLLQLHGYRVRSAFNGQEALRYLNAGFEPAIIVLDLRMPVMDGHEFLWALSSDPRLAEFRVIVHSVDPSHQFPAAVIGRVPKGHDPSALLDLVARACPLPGSLCP